MFNMFFLRKRHDFWLLIKKMGVEYTMFPRACVLRFTFFRIWLEMLFIQMRP